MRTCWRLCSFLELNLNSSSVSKQGGLTFVQLTSMAVLQFIAASEEHQLEKARNGKHFVPSAGVMRVGLKAGVTEWMTNMVLHWPKCSPRFPVRFLTLDSGFTLLHTGSRAQAREANQVWGTKALGNRQLLGMVLKCQPWSLKWRRRTWGKRVRWGSLTGLPQGTESCVQLKWLLQLGV